MEYLVLGLILFLGVHSVRIVAEGWRSRMVERMGAMPFKAVYSIVSVVGFGLIIWGFGQARQTPVLLWVAPVGLRHALSLLNLVGFVLLVAAYIPNNFFKARFHHPMILGVKSWALAHLLVNGFVAQLVLFGSFLVWAVADYIAARRRDRLQGTVYAPANTTATVVTVVLGVGAWAVFAFVLHGMLIGNRPFG
jgi:uncharacterized membrane protein